MFDRPVKLRALIIIMQVFISISFIPFFCNLHDSEIKIRAHYTCSVSLEIVRTVWPISYCVYVFLKASCLAYPNFSASLWSLMKLIRCQHQQIQAWLAPNPSPTLCFYPACHYNTFIIFSTLCFVHAPMLLLSQPTRFCCGRDLPQRLPSAAQPNSGISLLYYNLARL